MAFVALLQNDLNVYVQDFSLEEDGSPLPDAELIAHFGINSNPPPAIAAATNAAPIVVTAAGHGLADGDEVLICRVAGNYAANGLWTVANATADSFELADSVGDGEYIPDTGVYYAAIAGATGLTLVHQGGSRNEFLAHLSRLNAFKANQQLVMVVECTNYGVHFEIPGVARVRS